MQALGHCLLAISKLFTITLLIHVAHRGKAPYNDLYDLQYFIPKIELLLQTVKLFIIKGQSEKTSK